MKTLRTTVRATKDAAANFSRIYDDAMNRALKQSAEVLRDTIKEEIVNRKLVAEEHLLDSIRILDVDDSSPLKVAQVGSDDIAAHVAEYGSKPAGVSKIDVRPIRVWMTAKGVHAKYGTDEEFAQAIAKKIAKQGLPTGGKNPKRPFNVAQKRAKRKIDKIWKDIVAGL